MHQSETAICGRPRGPRLAVEAALQCHVPTQDNAAFASSDGAAFIALVAAPGTRTLYPSGQQPSAAGSLASVLRSAWHPWAFGGHPLRPNDSCRLNDSGESLVRVWPKGHQGSARSVRAVFDPHNSASHGIRFRRISVAKCAVTVMPHSLDFLSICRLLTWC
jgi:hypothetical protein